jgi:branched-chain amino acid transport system permease protein
MEYILHLFILIAFYTMLSQSLSLTAGFAGMVSLAHAGFYGIGAYTTAILSVNYGHPFWINLPIAMILCGILAFVISFIALRTADDYFIICTLGIQVIIYSIMNNWMDVTKGPLGIPAIPSITLFGLDFSEKVLFLILSFLLMLIVWLILFKISESNFGKTLIAISEDEVFTQSIGKNVHQTKVITFTLSAILAAIPGTLYAHYISYIDPTSFTVSESIFILSIVIIGGMTNLKGSFYAATFMVLLPEILRFVGLPDSIAANLRQIFYGLCLVLVMMDVDLRFRKFSRRLP